MCERIEPHLPESITLKCCNERVTTYTSFDDTSHISGGKTYRQQSHPPCSIGEDWGVTVMSLLTTIGDVKQCLMRMNFDSLHIDTFILIF